MTCTPCAKARKFMPAPVREQLERLEQRMIDRKAAKDENQAPASAEESFTAETLPLTGKDRP